MTHQRRTPNAAAHVTCSYVLKRNQLQLAPNQVAARSCRCWSVMAKRKKAKLEHDEIKQEPELVYPVPQKFIWTQKRESALLTLLHCRVNRLINDPEGGYGKFTKFDAKWRPAFQAYEAWLHEHEKIGIKWSQFEDKVRNTQSKAKEMWSKYSLQNRPSGSPVSAADYANHMDMEAAVRKWPLFSMYINYFWNVQDFCITASSTDTITLAQARRQRLAANAAAGGGEADEGAAAAAAAGEEGEECDDVGADEGPIDIERQEADAVDLLADMAAGRLSLEGELLPIGDDDGGEEQEAGAEPAMAGELDAEVAAMLDELRQGEVWEDDAEPRQPDERRRSFSAPPSAHRPRRGDRHRGKAGDDAFDFNCSEDDEVVDAGARVQEDDSPYHPTTAERAAAAADLEECTSDDEDPIPRSRRDSGKTAAGGKAAAAAAAGGGAAAAALGAACANVAFRVAGLKKTATAAASGQQQQRSAGGQQQSQQPRMAATPGAASARATAQSTPSTSSRSDQQQAGAAAAAGEAATPAATKGKAPAGTQSALKAAAAAAAAVGNAGKGKATSAAGAKVPAATVGKMPHAALGLIEGLKDINATNIAATAQLQKQYIEFQAKQKDRELAQQREWRMEEKAFKAEEARKQRESEHRMQLESQMFQARLMQMFGGPMVGGMGGSMGGGMGGGMGGSMGGGMGGPTGGAAGQSAPTEADEASNGGGASHGDSQHG